MPIQHTPLRLTIRLPKTPANSSPDLSTWRTKAPMPSRQSSRRRSRTRRPQPRPSSPAGKWPEPRDANDDATDLPKGVREGVLRGRPSLQPTLPPLNRAWRSGGVPRGGPRPQPPGANAHGDSEQPPRVGLPPPVVGPGFENRSPTRAHAACPLPPGGQVRVTTRRVLPQHPYLRTQYPPANASYAQLRAAWPIPS